MRRSALYSGTVRHRRMEGPRHEFSYRVWYGLIELDELVDLDRDLKFFSHNRFNLVGFDDRDHMGPAAEPVVAKLERWLHSRGVRKPLGRVSVLTHLRVLGHVFNPVSFFFCRSDDEAPRHVVAEVNNTFGDSFCYLLEADGSLVRDEADKVFHVSPFQPVDGRYRFRVTTPAERMTAHIDMVRGGERVFDSTLSLERLPLTAGSLLRIVLRHPHTGLRTLGLIHYQALRLWIKGAPFFGRPEPPVGAWRTRNG